MRKLFALAAVAALLVVFATTAFGATRTVKVGDNWFVKPGNGSKTVAKGTVVRWKNVGTLRHSVTVRKGPVKFGKSVLNPGAVYKRKMTRKGRYRIVCRFHTGQRMTLRVR